MKFPGNGHITKSELDAFLKAFEDEVFNLLVVRIWATPCTRLCMVPMVSNSIFYMKNFRIIIIINNNLIIISYLCILS